MKSTNSYLGFSSASELKQHLVDKNRKLIGEFVTAVVRDPSDSSLRSLYLLSRGKCGETLYVILPDSKALCVAKVRSERTDMPYIFEVLA